MFSGKIEPTGFSPIESELLENWVALKFGLSSLGTKSALIFRSIHILSSSQKIINLFSENTRVRQLCKTNRFFRIYSQTETTLQDFFAKILRRKSRAKKVLHCKKLLVENDKSAMLPQRTPENLDVMNNVKVTNVYACNNLD